MDEHTNRLINEKSPYLLQHAHNPVDWHPWSEEAFEKARKEDKPVFLSIGYSTCHWCHVMERESFEDEGVAKVLNEVFVCIKVDREERPDLDSTYMIVSQMMTGSGGWPLNIIMTPEKKPIFALTYIPKESRHGQMGLVELAKGINDLWKESRNDLETKADEVIGNMKKVVREQSGDIVNEETLNRVYDSLKANFDRDNGGFGVAPKFPSPHNLLFLMRHFKRHGESESLEMVEKTLLRMRMGGVYDQIGFGFHRYSTDSGWFLPHFEKMIYDQALLMLAYTDAFVLTGNDFYKHVSDEILEFVKREMLSPEGGVYTAIDADSENEEGKYYTWKWEEIMSALGNDDG
ncbi:MAG TPA: thioredoxin domain-containing protein, partial [Thermoplasmataceae archaeon]|nr:thioredoxin domain-containing protein [Thermoplasmataceae archaeon]